MEFSEKNLEDIIFNADKKKLKEKGLFINGKLIRQVKIGNYGIADLIEIKKPVYIKDHYVHDCVEVTIYELKKNEINLESFAQILRYAKGVSQYLLKKGYREDRIFIHLCLIGRSMSKEGGFVYLPDFTYVKCITYYYNEDGIKFENHCGYRLSNQGF